MKTMQNVNEVPSLLVFEPARVEEELPELRRVLHAEVGQADGLLDVAHDLVPPP